MVNFQGGSHAAEVVAFAQLWERARSRLLADLAADSGNARAEWFDEFTAEARIVVSGTWPPGIDPDGPEDLTGERTDLTDRAAADRQFPRLAAFRRDHP